MLPVPCHPIPRLYFLAALFLLLPASILVLGWLATEGLGPSLSAGGPQPDVTHIHHMLVTLVGQGFGRNLSLAELTVHRCLGHSSRGSLATHWQSHLWTMSAASSHPNPLAQGSLRSLPDKHPLLCSC